MPSENEFQDDGLGPDLLDRGSGKAMGRSGGGGSSEYDPSYDDALRILGRGYEIPSPYAQMALVMDDPDAKELAGRLTALRSAVRSGPTPYLGKPIGRPQPDAGPIQETVEEFIAALQEVPPNQTKLASLRRQLTDAGSEFQHPMEMVWNDPNVQARLNADQQSSSHTAEK